MAQRRLRAGHTATRALLLGSVGLVFWFMLFGIIYRMLRYFKATPGIGDILAVKLLGLILLAFLSVLLLSNLITALTSFFLARDLELLSAAPIDGLRVYGARLIETLIQSSWMVVLVLIPVLSAYGIVYRADVAFALTGLLALVAYLLLPAVTGAAITLVLVNVFPARRARDLLALLALFGATGLIVLLRLLRPEQLARPEGFRDLVDFVAALNTPSSVWLPSEWTAEAILATLDIPHLKGDLFPLLLLTSSAAAFVVVGAWLHERLYREGFSRSQEGAELKRGASRRAGLERTLSRMPVTARSLIAKDVRTFFRDTTQWSQLILLVVLVVIYVYNIKVLPLWSGEQVSFFLINVVSFINLGLAGFVLAAIAARFLYPAISLEGRTLWLLRSSPLNLRSLIWSKYFVGLTPLLLLALTLTILTNYILRVSGFMMALSIVTITVMSFAIASLALGFGTLYPRFETDNAAEISTGFGGLLFMMSAIAYLGAVITLEAMPVHDVLRARATGAVPDSDDWVRLVMGLGAAAGLSLAVIVWPLSSAQRRLSQLNS